MNFQQDHERVLLESILGRGHSFLRDDIKRLSGKIGAKLSGARVLVIGGAGSIGAAFVRELCCYEPWALHIIDLSENNLVELVRDLRSRGGPVPYELKTFAIDFSGVEMKALLESEERYDYVLNFAALKHVRSERDPFTLMRLLQTNVIANEALLCSLRHQPPKRVFSVSSDKAVCPASIMGASKAFMERVFLSHADDIDYSSARFANVAFSDGSLLHGFNHRIAKGQPISAPSDVRRFFINHQEAGQLCILSCLDGNNREVYFPKLVPAKDLLSFADIARQYLASQGLEPIECCTEQEALAKAAERRPDSRQWPCLFSTSDTSGEKGFEEFVYKAEEVDYSRYLHVGVVKSAVFHGRDTLDLAISAITKCKERGNWQKSELLDAVKLAVPEISHIETERNLDQKM